VIDKAVPTCQSF